MIITAIQRQKKREARYSIFADDTYVFSLDELELSGSTLRVGDELTSDEIEQWRQRSSAGKSYDAALRYLSYRQRSRFELRQHLQTKDYDDGTIEATLERLSELALIDDGQFARAWVGERNRLRPRSKLALKSELLAKGIDRDLIEEVLSEQSHDDEVVVLRRLINQKAHRYADEQKLMAYLASKGYSYGLIKAALADDES